MKTGDLTLAVVNQTPAIPIVCLKAFSDNRQNRKYAHRNSLAAKQQELWELSWPDLRDHTKLFANQPEPLSTPLTTSTLPASRPQLLFLAVREMTQQIIHHAQQTAISRTDTQ